MQPWLPRLLMVPDWWKSKCGGRLVMPYFSTPPDFALGSAALSWNFEPSYSMGTPCAQAWNGRPNAPAPLIAPMAAAPLTKFRRFTRDCLESFSCIALPSHLVFCRPSTVCSDGLSILFVDQG